MRGKRLVAKSTVFLGLIVASCGEKQVVTKPSVHHSEDVVRVPLPETIEDVETSLTFVMDEKPQVVWTFGPSVQGGTWDLYRAPSALDVTDALLIRKDIPVAQSELVLDETIFLDGHPYIFAELKTGSLSTLYFIQDPISLR